jgi:hypothetical protein
MAQKALFRAGMLLLALLLLPGLVGCGAISNLVATPTPTATSTPTLTPTPTPTPTPKFFVIQSKVFDQGENCFEPTVLEISQEAGQSDLSIKVVSGSLTIKKNRFVVFCYEAKHIWLGTAVYEGYTFISDKENPLQFQVTRDKGYVYLQGKGKVKMPNGTVVDLP